MMLPVAALLTLQILVPLNYAALGALGLWVERRLPDRDGPVARAWLLTGLAFLLMGAGNTAQSVWAAVAYQAGPATDVYGAYLYWMPVQDQGRSVLMLAFAVLLAGLPAVAGRAAPGAFLARCLAGLLAGLALGSLLGWAEGGFETERHWSLKAMVDAVQLVALLGALALTLVHHRVDRHLWLVLALLALVQALNVIWISAMAWFDTPGAWAPDPLYLQASHLVVSAGMLALAAGRLALARRGVRVPSPLEALEPQRIRTLG